MSWNYRVIRSVDPNGNEFHAIHEVYYGDGVEPEGWTATPVAPCGDDLNEVRSTLQHMHRALDEPVLTVVLHEGKEFLREL